MTKLSCWVPALAAAGLVLALAPDARAGANPKNGLSSESLRLNALTVNPIALGKLRGRALTSALFDDADLAQRLHDPNARAVFAEIVKCALGSATSIAYADPLDGGRPYAWFGELGICQRPGSAEGDWTTGAPTEACQQRVTACVASRVNALGKAVPISLRAESALPAPQPTVSTERRYRESESGEDPSEGVLVGSFTGPVCLVGRECFWAPAYVGRCTGGQVSLSMRPLIGTISNPAPSCSEVRVRVCAGLHGCLGASGGGWDEPPGFPAQEPYSKVLSEKLGACDSAPITFTCPMEAQYGGTYSVMARRPPQGTSVLASPEYKKLSGTGTYPTPERELFTFREGAFYGNLFDPDGLRATCELVPDGTAHVLRCVANADQRVLGSCWVRGGSGECTLDAKELPYSRVYACYSFAQQQNTVGTSDQVAIAYLNQRICNRPDAGTSCFANAPVRCMVDAGSTAPSAGCSAHAASGSFQDCRGQGADAQRTYRPITTYLNEPCDLLGPGAGCAIFRKAVTPVSPSQSPQITAGAIAANREAGRGARGCGCAPGGGSGPIGGLWAGALAALAAYSFRRRRTPRRAAC